MGDANLAATYTLIYSFLTKQQHAKAAAALKKAARDIVILKDDVPIDGPPLDQIIDEWKKIKEEPESSSDSDSDSESSSDSSSDSDSDGVAGEVKKPSNAAAKDASSDSGSDSSSSSDSESSVSVVQKAKVDDSSSDTESSSSDSDGATVEKARNARVNDSSSSSSSDSESGAIKKKASNPVAGGSSSSDSSSESSSESEGSHRQSSSKVNKTNGIAVPSQRVSKQEFIQVTKKRRTDENGGSVATRVTSTVSEEPTNAQWSGRNKQVRKPNTPFRKFDPVKFQSHELIDNRYEAKVGPSNDYGAKAHADLIVTRGASFRKEKNKKKRGSYRGGEITMQSHSIKFT